LTELIAAQLKRNPETMTIYDLGTTVVTGPLIARLQGEDADLSTSGIARTIHRVGFQKHDGLIYQQLLARGGVLIAVHNEPRAADALATFHAYGGGNAAIGAWHGRV
jgi:hypothetical protein